MVLSQKSTLSDFRTFYRYHTERKGATWEEIVRVGVSSDSGRTRPNRICDNALRQKSPVLVVQGSALAAQWVRGQTFATVVEQGELDDAR